MADEKCPDCGAEMSQWVGGTGNCALVRHRPGGVLCTMRQLDNWKARAEAAEGIVAKLDKTADGVVVEPYRTTLYLDGRVYSKWRWLPPANCLPRGAWFVLTEGDRPYEACPAQCYSTHELAAAALAEEADE